MTDQQPAPFADLDPSDYALAFTPVATKPRHDGWTPERQRHFILLLRAMGVVAGAAKAVGCTAQSAYRLRLRDDAADFAAAWDRALAEGRSRAFDLAYERAVEGVEVPRYRRGKMVGTVRQVDSRILIAALAYARAAPPARPVPGGE
jgi:hypothetical protein